MELKTCSNGHAYDARLASCPLCESEGFEQVGKTQPVNEGIAADPGLPDEVLNSYTQTEPVSHGFDPITSTEPNGNFDADGKTHPVSVDNGQTMPVGTFSFRPVVGWLVCVEGPNRGTSYPIHPGYNYIGRTSNRDIYIPNDSTISAKQAWIAYDKSEDGNSDTFAFGPSEGTNTCRVNGKAQYSPIDLNPYDSIKLGNSKFLFVPFCSDKFRW